MFPWLTYWAPEVRYPFSGAVVQDISPETVFGAIEPQAGNAAVEAEVFRSKAAYGKQLGILTDVVLALVDKSAIDEADAKHALEQLHALREQIGEVKARHKQSRHADARRLLQSLRQTDHEGFAQLMREFS